GHGAVTRPQSLYRHHQRRRGLGRRSNDAAAGWRLGHASRGSADPAGLRPRRAEEPRRGAGDHAEGRLRAREAAWGRGDDPQRLVREIEKKLAEDAARPAIFYPVSAACWQPYFKGHTMMVNGNYNGWRLEDAWFDR